MPPVSSSSAAPAFSAGRKVPGARQPRFPKKVDIAEWFYVPSWKRTTSPPRSQTVELAESSWLIFTGACDGAGDVEPRLGLQLAERLAREAANVVTVRAGAQFKRDGSALTIDPASRDDYTQLFAALRARGSLPTRVVYFANASPHDGLGQTGNRRPMARRELHQLLFPDTGFGDQLYSENVELVIVSDSIHDVTGDEASARIERMMLGPCRVSLVSISCRNLVVKCRRRGTQLVVGQLWKGAQTGGCIAYRGRHRCADLRADSAASPDAAGLRLKRNGVYLITWRAGQDRTGDRRILARAVAAKLVLTGRTARSRAAQPVPGSPDGAEANPIARKLNELRALGSEILLIDADVANLEQMRAGVVEATEQFGCIDGVIHSAGILGDGAIQHKTPQQVDAVLRPKVIGALVLDEIFKDSALDFLMLFSSLSAVKPAF